MCKKTLQNIISMYYNNITNDIMLKAIAFRAVEEGIKNNHIKDVIDLCNCDIFSEKFKGYLANNLIKNVGLNEDIFVKLIYNEKIDFNNFDLNILKRISQKLDVFKNTYKSDVFDNFDMNLKDHILNISVNEDIDYILNFIHKNENYNSLRSKYLIKIKEQIPLSEYNKLNNLIQDDMLCETKGIPKRIIEKREKGALKHLI